MKKSLKNLMGSALAGAMLLGMGAGNDLQAQTYQATFYVAGMGGHFAKAVTIIDPSAETPITVSELTMVEIGDGTSHPVHDARIDYKDRNTMYWSTYKLDPDADDMTHAGYTDLRTGEVVKDITLKTPSQVKNTKKMYCASAQTPAYFMPISMSNPGYIDVIRKKDMKRLHSVFLEGTDADFKVPYKYLHGINSPDMSKVLIAANESDNPSKAYGNGVGKLHLVMLDAAALTAGKVKVLAKGIADGNKKSTISFRQYFSNDGKKVANATGDILFIIDADNLKTLDAETVSPTEQLHDAIFTPDDRYVIATSRTKRVSDDCETPLKPGPDEYLMDGHLKLYDVKAGKFIGKSTSVCLACHDNEIGTDDDAPHAVLCGFDANWK